MLVPVGLSLDTKERKEKVTVTPPLRKLKVVYILLTVKALVWSNGTYQRAYHANIAGKAFIRHSIL